MLVERTELQNWKTRGEDADNVAGIYMYVILFEAPYIVYRLLPNGQS